MSKTFFLLVGLLVLPGVHTKSQSSVHPSTEGVPNVETHGPEMGTLLIRRHGQE